MKIIIFPGRNQKWSIGIGEFLCSEGYSPTGIDLTKNFMKMDFQDQLSRFSNLVSEYWEDDTLLIGKSYGAYALIHSLSDLPPFPGSVVLFSPVLGKAFVNHNGQFFCSIPPRSKKILQIIEKKSFPAPRQIDIHTGADDNGCDPILAKKFTHSIPEATISIVPHTGHNLSQEYEKNAILNTISKIKLQ